MEPETPERFARTVRELLSQKTYRLKNEEDLQSQISNALEKARIPHKREVELSPTNRIDFLLQQGVGIEVKINGAGTGLLHQINRYAKEERIQCLLVITIRPSTLPDTLKGKKIFSLSLWNHLDVF